MPATSWRTLKKTKPALIGDTTAYGQGGFNLLKEDFAKLKVTPVLAESSSLLISRTLTSASDEDQGFRS